MILNKLFVLENNPNVAELQQFCEEERANIPPQRCD